eukprot:GILI01004147.1.p1 GENE.GILI01004147.1~~GILI01004147.1.p1  ORF type:complete len:340 (+),score=43.64 GILI01004147.1:201-1220(+)
MFVRSSAFSSGRPTDSACALALFVLGLMAIFFGLSFTVQAAVNKRGVLIGLYNEAIDDFTRGRYLDELRKGSFSVRLQNKDMMKMEFANTEPYVRDSPQEGEQFWSFSSGAFAVTSSNFIDPVTLFDPAQNKDELKPLPDSYLSKFKYCFQFFEDQSDGGTNSSTLLPGLPRCSSGESGVEVQAVKQYLQEVRCSSSNSDSCRHKCEAYAGGVWFPQGWWIWRDWDGECYIFVSLYSVCVSVSKQAISSSRFQYSRGCFSGGGAGGYRPILDFSKPVEFITTAQVIHAKDPFSTLADVTGDSLNFGSGWKTYALWAFLCYIVGALLIVPFSFEYCCRRR